jgi:N-dimethylarginine dimethylaminohydrolase
MPPGTTVEVSSAQEEGGDEEQLKPLEIGCYSDYGTLRVVMVGRTDDLAYPAWSPNIRYLTGEVAELLSSATGSAVNLREQAPELWESVTADVERIADTLREHGVEVVRPRKFLPEEMQYLEHLQGGHSLLYPADPTYVLGKHVIETSFRRPFRRKETWATRDVLMPGIEADPEVRHVSIPRARPHPAGEEGPGPFLEGGDLIMIDANNVLCGTTNLTSNEAGRSWLMRYLEPFDIRVHPVDVQGTWLHLLGVMCVVREGLAMAYMPALGGKLPEPIADWEVIELTEQETLDLASVGMNVDQKKHLIDQRFERVIGELERHGMEPVPVDVRHLSSMGGAVRCVALPIARDAD